MKRSDPPPTRPDARVRILQAAAEEFVSRGYHQARLSQVAKSAGVSRSTLYEHFPGKDQLLLALNHELIGEMLATMRETLRAEPSAGEGLRRWYRSAVTPSPQQRTMLRIMYADAVQSSLLLNREAVQDAARQAGLWIGRLLREGIRRGEFRPDMNIRRTSHSLQQLHSLLTRQAVNDYPLIDFGSDRGETTIDLLIRGLLNPAQNT